MGTRRRAALIMTADSDQRLAPCKSLRLEGLGCLVSTYSCQLNRANKTWFGFEHAPPRRLTLFLSTALR